MRLRRQPVFTVALLLVAAVLSLSAQYTTATFGGTVLDSSGAAVPNAKVAISNAGTGFSQTVSSDANGLFLFSRLPVGTYQLRVDKEGFSSYIQSGIQLTVNQIANQTVTMQLGPVSESVSVEANAELVTTRSPRRDSSSTQSA